MSVIATNKKTKHLKNVRAQQRVTTVTDVKSLDNLIFVSLGDRCIPALSFEKLGVKSASLPFDWVRGNAKITYDAISTNFQHFYDFKKSADSRFGLLDIMKEKHPSFPSTHINYYGMYFVHHQNMTRETLIDTLKRRCERFVALLNENNVTGTEKHIVFVRSRLCNDPFREQKYYNFVQKLDHYICSHYPKLKYTILNIESENTYPNTGNIVNMTYDEPVNVLANSVNRKEQLLLTNVIRTFVQKRFSITV